MKKLLYFFILAIAVALASCAKDDVVLPDMEGDTVVSFTVNALDDETSPQAVRSYNDGKKIRDLEYAIYKKESDGTYKFIKAVDAQPFFAEGEQSGTFTEKLGYGKTYVIMLWADCTDDNYILNWSREDINDCTAAIYKTENLIAQDDNADAFCGKVEITVSDEAPDPINLTRPFAQVNVCTDDYEAAVTRGFTATTTGMKVNAYTSLNLFSGEAGGKQDITFALKPIPTGDDAKMPIEGKEWTRIAMNYLFAPEESEDISVTFYANSTSNTLTWDNIGIARNQRTNICGSLLSNNDDWQVYYTEFDIKVMQWNICCAWKGAPIGSSTEGYLAEIDGVKIGHPWWVRRAAIVERIKESDADIILLQELNCTWPVNFFRDIMQLLNGNGTNLGSDDSFYNGSPWPVETYNGSTYYGVMIKRGSYTHSSNGYSADEGNAIIYKTNKFTDVTSNVTSKNHYFWLHAKSAGVDEQDVATAGGQTAYSKRICLFKRLRHEDTGKEFAVACTHLDNNKEGDDYPIQNQQVQQMLNHLKDRALTDTEDRAYEATAEADKLNRCPIIIGGDMNVNPTLSPALRFGYSIAGGYRTEANPEGNTGSNNDFANCYTATIAHHNTITYSNGSSVTFTTGNEAEGSRSTMVDLSYDSDEGKAYYKQNDAQWDYIFMRWGNSVKSYRIWSPVSGQFTYDGTTYNGVFLSDHNAISAVINLRYYK